MTQHNLKVKEELKFQENNIKKPYLGKIYVLLCALLWKNRTSKGIYTQSLKTRYYFETETKNHLFRHLRIY